MSKTFKSHFPDSEFTLTAKKDHSGSRVYVRIEDAGKLTGGIVLDSSDAPALMLAVAEASGIVHHDPDDTPYATELRTENMGDLNIAAHYLARHVNQAEKAAYIAAREAADREALEAEAWELYTTAFPDHPSAYENFKLMPAHLADAWVRVANVARAKYGVKP